MSVTKQRRLVALLLTVLLLLTASSVCALAAADAEKDYLALGDSISTGYGLSSPETEGYTYLVTEKLEYTLANRAVNGYTAEDIYHLVKDGALDAQIADAELITLTCGGNDLMTLLYQAIADAYNAENDPDIAKEEVLSAFAGMHETLTMTALMPYVSTVLNGFAQTDAFEAGLRRYQMDLTAVMQYLHAKNSEALIVLCTQYNPYDAFEGHMIYGYLYTEVEAGVAALNRVITDSADALGYTVADVYTAFKGASANLCVANVDNMLAPNLDFHPNAEGHLVISKAVLSVVEPDSEEEATEMATGGTTDDVSEPETADVTEPFESTSSTDGSSESDGIESSDCFEESETDAEPSAGDTSEEASTDEPDSSADDGTTEAPSDDEGGCGSVIGFPAALFVLFVVAFAAILLRRRAVKSL